MNGYVAFFKSQRAEVFADTQYAALLKAIEVFKPRKSERHLVHVHLAELNGSQVVHVADF